MDASIRDSKGAVEDVLIKVGEFVFPVDFVVQDMNPSVKLLPRYESF